MDYASTLFWGLTMTSLSIRNQLVKDLRVAILEVDADRANSLEAQFDEDLAAQRARIYVTANVAEFRRLIHEIEPELCIFPDGFGGDDFVFLQGEIMGLSPAVKCIPLLSRLDLTQIREARRIGNLYDFGNASSLGNYSDLLSLIVGFAREHKSNTDFTPILRNFQAALTVSGNADWMGIKECSSEILVSFALLFDLSPREVTQMEQAEMLYFPWVKAVDYEKFVPDRVEGILEILKASGSWVENRKPTSPQGLVVTVSNYIAQQLLVHSTNESIVAALSRRPAWVKHPSIRVLNSHVIEDCIRNLGLGGFDARKVYEST